MMTVIGQSAGSQAATLKSLRDAADETLRQRAIAEVDTAPRHNVFKMFGLTRYEAWFHSPFLSDLLDPYGNHGQGAVFLRAFVALIASRRDWQCPAIEDWPLRYEWEVRLEADRVDISVRSWRHGWLLFVENKIGANFQPDQMRRYKKLLDSRTEFRCRALILLAPKAFEGTPDVDPDVSITYQDDIVPWLESVLDRVHSERVKANIGQYVQVARDLDRKEAMTELDDLKRLLARPEYLRLGMEVAAAIEPVKGDLITKFWATVKNQLSDGMSELDLKGSWELRDDPNSEVPHQCFLTPRDTRLGGGMLAIGVFQEDNGAKLRYGLGFIQPVAVWPTKLNELREILIKAHGDVPPLKNQWWAYGRECSFRPDTPDFLAAIAGDVNEFAAQFTVPVLGILRDQRQLILDAGQVLVGT